ncbi:MAG: uncharacterized protein QG597_146 [Actinomycetota bacterium]|nr:uncharacterized protein [Actinomycetota bacterium]
MSTVGTRLSMSPFTARIRRETCEVWYHSITGRARRLSAAQADVVTRLLTAEDALEAAPARAVVEHLRTQGFLVADPKAERERAHRDYLTRRDQISDLFLTVAPTMACNLHCDYCFQAGSPALPRMSRTVQQAMVDLVGAWLDTPLESDQGRALVVQWFGGEPLLARETLLRCTAGMLARAEHAGVGYDAELLTNGLLLPTRGVRELLPRLHLSAVHISLDGNAASYAERKGVPPAQARRLYERLASCLPEILEVVGRIVLRVNVDRRNVEETGSLLEFLAARGAADRRVLVRLGQIGVSDGDCRAHDCLSGARFTSAEVALAALARTWGFGAQGLPEPLLWTCGATLRRHVTVGPDGVLGRCVPEIGAVGDGDTSQHRGTVRTITDTDSVDLVRRLRARGLGHECFDPYREPGCDNCPLIGTCLGACPRDRQSAWADPCPARQNLEERIVAFA